MRNTFKDKKELVMQGYIVLLAVSAIMFNVVMRYCYLGFDYDEHSLFVKTCIPIVLSPMLVCVLLSALFIDNGHSKRVGIGGLLLMIAMTIIQTGSMIWMQSLETGDDILITHYDYNLRLPMAIFVASSSFMRGGAIALIMSILSLKRKSSRKEEITLFAVIGLSVCIASFWLIYVRLCLSGSLVVLAGSLFTLLLIPALIYYWGLGKEKKPLISTSQETLNTKVGIRRVMLTLIIVILFSVTILSVWRYYPQYWGVSYKKEIVYKTVFSFSLLAMAVGLITLMKKDLSAKKNLLYIGSLLLLVGLPLATLSVDVIIIDAIPQILIGVSASLLFYSTADYIIRLQTKHHAMMCVGVTVLIIILSRLMIFIFNQLEYLIHTKAVALYIIYPLMALTLMVLSHQYQEEKEELSHE